MHKNAMLKILNPILAVLTVTQAFSALLADRLSHEAFEWIHQGGGTLLLIGIVLHVALNWSWVRASLLPHR
ncbi:MAG: hypothetical protein ABFE01_22840 [Phycisphaerales bacterium]|jgi:drug/metabolite transporter (DMT)-like permease